MTEQNIVSAPPPPGRPTEPKLVLLVAQARAVLVSNPQEADAHLLLLESLLTPLDSTRTPGARASGGLSPWQLARVKRHIDERLEERLSIAGLAQIANFSCSHFCRAFKVSTGVTPHTFVVGQRLAKAQRLIHSTNESFSQIALICGLADQAHLSRLFRRDLGCSPSHWRRLSKNVKG